MADPSVPRKACVECGKLVRECSTPDEHEHWCSHSVEESEEFVRGRQAGLREADALRAGEDARCFICGTSKGSTEFHAAGCSYAKACGYAETTNKDGFVQWVPPEK